MTPEDLQNLSAAQVRDAAADCWRAREWARLLRLAERLRQDPQWPVFWCALCAVGAGQLGRPDAHELLREAVRSGYVDVPVLRAELQETFGAHEHWEEITAAIAANLPPQPVTLISWPVPELMWPLRLCSLPPAREEMLLSRLPQRQLGSWDTAVATLAWVATRWVHANHRAKGEDAVQILDRVASGGRFACPEYATVLSQSLNALRVPARYVGLLLASYHAGFARGHVVAEAWIDDLGKWVVLDSQNGVYWCSDDGTPLGLAELRLWHESRGRRPTAICVARPIGERRLDAWWDYFCGPASIAGRQLSPEPLGLTCEGHPLISEIVQRDAQGLYPRLDRPSIGIASAAGHPALTLRSVHPYVTGFFVRAGNRTVDLSADQATWPLDPGTPGHHSIHIGIVTPYGRLAAEVVSYEVV